MCATPLISLVVFFVNIPAESNLPFQQLRVDVLSSPVTSTSLPISATAAAEATSAAPHSNSDEEPPLVPIPPSPNVDEVLVHVRPSPPGTPFHPSDSPHLVALPLLPYPIVLTARGQKVYVVAQNGFDVLEMFKNPMMMMMLLAGVMVFLLPKALVCSFSAPLSFFFFFGSIGLIWIFSNAGFTHWSYYHRRRWIPRS